MSADFLARHEPGTPLLMPNAWDVGSARLLASLGFRALATTSSGFAATLGRLDGRVTRDEVIAHAAALAAAVEVPVSVDFENGFAADVAGVTESFELLAGTGAAGASIEDWGGRFDQRIYPVDVAAERVAAAAAVARAGARRLTLTARAENHIHGVDDLDDTIARLQAYAAAGADVLFAPGLRSIDDIRRVVSAVERPVSVLVLAGMPPVSSLASAGVARISVGGAFAFAAYGAVVEAAQELSGAGTYTYWDSAAVGGKAVRGAFAD